MHLCKALLSLFVGRSLYWVLLIVCNLLGFLLLVFRVNCFLQVLLDAVHYFFHFYVGGLVVLVDIPSLVSRICIQPHSHAYQLVDSSSFVHGTLFQIEVCAVFSTDGTLFESSSPL